VVAYEQLATFEFGIAAELFGVERPEFAPWYEYRTCSCDGKTVTATGGVRVSVHGGLRLLSTADTIVIPGWRGVTSPAPQSLLRALRRAHDRRARILSFCTGAFVLAAAGLLDNRRATTHWRHAQVLSTRFPQVTVDPDVLYVQEGNLFTAAGSASAIDLCLHVIRQDHGAQVANQLARRLVVPPHREGGQAQYLDSSVAEEGRLDFIQDAMTWAKNHLQEDVDVAEWAASSGMSERTFARRFRATTGTTPHRWLTRQRVFFAQTLLETSDLSVEEITSRCGMGSAANLRHHFSELVGVSPRAYRATFHGRRSPVAPAPG
jgi:AraC family transcriptional regulator, transcriptional activator FtrA